MNLNPEERVLVPGAIANSLDRFDIVHLTGNPIVINKRGYIRPLKLSTEYPEFVRECQRIFGKTETSTNERLYPLLAELYDSIHEPLNNLNPEYIKSYITKRGDASFIVLWSGDTDRTILTQLGIQFTMLNLTARDLSNTGTYTLTLTNFTTRRTLFSIELGPVVTAKGNVLSLFHTHSVFCGRGHFNCIQPHHPITDLQWTRCIFDRLVRKMTYKRLCAELTNSH